MSTESHGGIIFTGETEELGEKPVPMLLVHHKSNTDSGREPKLPL
jgi:hypothetical protein